MKVVCFVGNSYRHRYILDCIEKSVGLAGAIVEQRESFIPAPAESLDSGLKALFNLHFAGRADAESSFFPKTFDTQPNCKVLEVSKADLNGPRTMDFLKSIQPDVVLSYGVHKLTPSTLAVCPTRKWNIHGGLSPWYRGVATHFWPSYMLEPQMTGMTLHELTDDIDGGNVIHQTVAPLIKGDGIHELACRTVGAFGLELSEVLKLVSQGAEIVPKKQTTTGKIWIEKDWRPEHLRTIYQAYENRIVDAQLEGKLNGRNPLFYSQLQVHQAESGTRA